MTGNDGFVPGRCSFGYADREWADYALGHLDAREASGMEAHASLCAACAERRDEWMRLLGPADGGPAASPLPERRRRALRRAVRAVGLRRRLRRPVLAVCAATVLLTAGFLLRAGVSVDPIRGAAPNAMHALPGEYLLQREPDAVPVLADPDTTQFRVVRIFGMAGEGYIWLSGDAREALFYLYGLPDTDQVDYQAWAMRGPHADSLGILKLFDGVAHLHVRSMLLPDAEMISLSAEPKGGSERPTSPPAALVRFEARP
ncbi:MAG: hypothetical protein A9Z00_04535 [Thermobacillus sp. ZCTH02-B1]|uniref:anti-sigma factor n=1 Tax=Thermobacillus sp. ZCTH02-B1 TaxID=1858795 RepID=UPI000B577088|nr:anti-sigma factor [Thermobacillus sp. ZCTH02-B1]OUM96845.1 MAG: hypothetical protein A9Z00_04535 [Thermobacillus sp. ZCTH02-B1]